MEKTAMTVFIDFLEKSKDTGKDFNYDLLIAFATELRDTVEKHDLLRAYMRNYDIKMCDDDFRKLFVDAKEYYHEKYGDNVDHEKKPK